LTAISAAEADVPSKPSVAIEEMSSFFMIALETRRIYHAVCRGPVTDSAQLREQSGGKRLRGLRCPLWVKSRHQVLKSRCPLYPQ
jgi:hypothetical protein